MVWQSFRRRPRGIILITAVIAVNGAVSLYSGVSSVIRVEAGLLPADLTLLLVLNAAVSILFGLYFLHRAYMLWNFRKGALRATLLALSIRAAIAAVIILFAARTFVAWIDFAVSVLTLMYLTRPRITSLYTNREAAR